MAFLISYTDPRTRDIENDKYLRIESVTIKNDHSGAYALIILVLFASEDAAKVHKATPKVQNIEIYCQGGDYDTYFKSAISNIPNLTDQQILGLTIEKLLKRAAYRFIKTLNPKDEAKDRPKVRWLPLNFKDDAIDVDND